MHINYVQVGPLYTSRGPLLAKHLFCLSVCSRHSVIQGGQSPRQNSTFSFSSPKIVGRNWLNKGKLQSPHNGHFGFRNNLLLGIRSVRWRCFRWATGWSVCRTIRLKRNCLSDICRWTQQNFNCNIYWWIMPLPWWIFIFLHKEMDVSIIMFAKFGALKNCRQFSGF